MMYLTCLYFLFLVALFFFISVYTKYRKIINSKYRKEENFRLCNKEIFRNMGNDMYLKYNNNIFINFLKIILTILDSSSGFVEGLTNTLPIEYDANNNTTNVCIITGKDINMENKLIETKIIINEDLFDIDSKIDNKLSDIEFKDSQFDNKKDDEKTNNFEIDGITIYDNLQMENRLTMNDDAIKKINDSKIEDNIIYNNLQVENILTMDNSQIKKINDLKIGDNIIYDNSEIEDSKTNDNITTEKDNLKYVDNNQNNTVNINPENKQPKKYLAKKKNVFKIKKKDASN